MAYVGLLVGVALIFLFTFSLAGTVGAVLYYPYRALGMTSDKKRFVTAYTWFSRIFGGVMILILLVLLGLHASDY